VELQVHLKELLRLSRKTQDTLDQLKMIPVKDGEIANAIRSNENRYGALLSDQEQTRAKYIAKVEFLGTQDEASVDAAVKLVHDDANAFTVDKHVFEYDEKVRDATDLLTGHIRLFRQGRLTPETIIIEMNG
jgi:hypothetical protein